MMTGAPGKALRVNRAANAVVGWSSAITVRFIRAGFGASRGVKSKLARPTRNPAGREDWAASHARCAARSAKVSCVLGTREKWAGRRKV
jgi:hypothetical protein